MCSYAALGLLPSIPLPQGGSNGSSSRSHRAKLPVFPGADEEIPVVGYGRIVRDEEGNVIDIILPEDDEDQEDVDQEEEEMKTVEARTDVVRCEF